MAPTWDVPVLLYHVLYHDTEYFFQDTLFFDDKDTEVYRRLSVKNIISILLFLRTNSAPSLIPLLYRSSHVFFFFLGIRKMNFLYNTIIKELFLSFNLCQGWIRHQVRSGAVSDFRKILVLYPAGQSTDNDATDNVVFIFD